MANWWEAAPLAEPEHQDAWWSTAPLTDSNASGGVMRAIDDFMRGAADTSSFGFADEIAAGAGALTGVGGERGEYAKNLAAERARDDEGGWARLAGQVAGAFTTPMAAAKTAWQAARQGAAVGGAYGFGSGEEGFLDRAEGGAKGAGFGGMAGGALHKVADALIGRSVRKNIPTVEDLRAAKNEAYKRVDDMGISYSPEQLAALRDGVTDTLSADGLDAVFHPRAARALQIVQDKTGMPQTLTELDRLRQFVRENVVDENPSMFTQRRMGGHIVNEIDEFVDAADAGSSAAIREARDLHGRLRRSEMVDEALKTAEHRAGSTYAGGNIDNASRQNIRAILDSPKKSRGFTDAEKDLMEKIVVGERGQNIARQVGKLSPSGNGLQQALALGATAYNPSMAIAPGVGLVAKALADRKTAQNIQELQRLIRGGSENGQKVAEAIMRIRKGESIALPAASRAAAALAQYVPVPY